MQNDMQCNTSRQHMQRKMAVQFTWLLLSDGMSLLKHYKYLHGTREKKETTTMQFSRLSVTLVPWEERTSSSGAGWLWSKNGEKNLFFLAIIIITIEWAGCIIICNTGKVGTVEVFWIKTGGWW